MKKTTITIQKPVNGVDGKGMPTKKWQEVDTISASLLPITRDLAVKYHGYDESVEKRGFYRGRRVDIQTGYRALIDGEKPLFFVSVLDYGKVVDFLLDKTVPGSVIGG